MEAMLGFRAIENSSLRQNGTNWHRASALQHTSSDIAGL